MDRSRQVVFALARPPSESGIERVIIATDHSAVEDLYTFWSRCRRTDPSVGEEELVAAIETDVPLMTAAIEAAFAPPYARATKCWRHYNRPRFRWYEEWFHDHSAFAAERALCATAVGRATYTANLEEFLNRLWPGARVQVAYEQVLDHPGRT